MAAIGATPRITSLVGLTLWNARPTLQKPIVIDWFSDYFVALLNDEDFDTAILAYNAFIDFYRVCDGHPEHFAAQQAANICDRWGKAGTEKTFYRMLGLRYLRGLAPKPADAADAELAESIP